MKLFELSDIENEELSNYIFLDGLIKTIKENGKSIFYFTKSNRCAILSLSIDDKFKVISIYSINSTITFDPSII